MEWIDYQDSLCSGCGNPKSECMSEDADGAYEAVPLQCHACAARDAEGRRASEMRRDDRLSASSLDGVYYGVVRREVNPDG